MISPLFTKTAKRTLQFLSVFFIIFLSFHQNAFALDIVSSPTGVQKGFTSSQGYYFNSAYAWNAPGYFDVYYWDVKTSTGAIFYSAGYPYVNDSALPSANFKKLGYYDYFFIHNSLQGYYGNFLIRNDKKLFIGTNNGFFLNDNTLVEIGPTELNTYIIDPVTMTKGPPIQTLNMVSQFGHNLSVMAGTIPVPIKISPTLNGFLYQGTDGKNYVVDENFTVDVPYLEGFENALPLGPIGNNSVIVAGSSVGSGSYYFADAGNVNGVSLLLDPTYVLRSFNTFENPVAYFTESNGGVVKWDMNCRTQGYDSCRLNNGVFKCTNSVGVLSPGGELCGGQVVLPSPSAPVVLSGSALSVYAGSIAKLVQNNNALITQSSSDGEKNLLADAADPVNLANGEFTYSNTFMQIPGVKNPYEFSLTYRNQTSSVSPVGHKFDHNYNMFLVENTGSVEFHDGRLGVFSFAETGSTYEYNKGLKARLSRDVSTGQHIITFDNGARYLFEPNLKISKLSDRYGNALTFGYNVQKQLTVVTDTLGREVIYAYDAQGHLQRVTDSGGRTVELAYTSGGDLQSVTITSGTESKTISYTYDSSHNILTLTDSKGQVYVNNVYDASNRVASQKYGSGIVSYGYTLTGSSVYTNDVTNANGVHTKYTYDANGNTTKREIFDTTGTGVTEYNYEFDSNARLAKAILPKGNGTTYKYDARGNIIMERQKTVARNIDAASDLVTTYEYDGVYDTPVKITLPNGLVKKFTLDSSGNILSETATGILNPDGTKYTVSKSYEYDSNGQLTRKIDAEGGVSSYVYASGQLVTLTHGTLTGSIEETFNYDAYGNLTSSSDGEGAMKLLSYTPFNLVANSRTAEGIETRFTYDANNNKTHEEKYSLAEGIVGGIDYEYDTLDHVTKKVEKIDVANSRTTVMTYDGNSNILTAQEGTGALVQYTYDEMNRVKTKRIIINPSAPSTDLVTTNHYDRNGNITRITDSLNRSTYFTYDLFDRLTKKTDATKAYSTFTYNKAGNILEAKSFDANDVLLQRTTNEYDLLGHVIRSTVYDLTNTPTRNVVTTTVYDRNGNIIQRTDARGAKTFFTYDSFGRPIQTEDALGNTTTLTYDKRSLVTTKSIAYPDSSYSLSTALSYDTDGRLVQETNAEGKTKKYTYNALNQLTKNEDENGHITEMTYDFLGHIVSEKKFLTNIPPVQGGSEAGGIITASTYNTSGNLTSITDPNGNTTTFQYDLLGRKIRETLPNAKTTTFAYDKNSNLTKVTDPNKNIVVNSYDTLNRLLSRAVTTGSGVRGTTAEVFSYDALGRLSSVTSTGQLSGSGEQKSSVTFAYDSLSRLTSEIQAVPGQSPVTVSYTYDANGNRTSLSTGIRYLTNYSYDELNRLTNVSYGSGNIADYSYSGTLLAQIHEGNEVTTSYAYDSLLRLSVLDHSNASGSITARNYSYDPASNLLSDGQKSYTYDSIDRLTGAFALSGTTLPTSSEAFTYDPTGNRTISTLDSKNRSYSGNTLNQYTSVSSGSTLTKYTYDANGNLTNNKVFTFTYDHKNRLVEVRKVADSSLVAQYVYDILGRRIQKLTPTTKTDYLYAGENAIQEITTDLALGTRVTINRIYGDGVDNLLAYYETNDTPVTDAEIEEYVFCSTSVFPNITRFTKYGYTNVTSRCIALQNQYTSSVHEMYFVQRDHLGSTVALTNSSGVVVQSYGYDVYGEPYVLSGANYVSIRNFTGSLFGNNRLFTGREYESGLGLYYYRARFYSPELGRFISRDPIGMGDDVNLYAYVGNSPMMGVDPSGKFVEKKDAQDQKELFEGQKNRARQAIESFGKNITLRQTEASLRSFSCKYDNIKCNESWTSVAYDKNKGTPAEPEGIWLAVIIDGKEITLDKLGGYFVGYNGKYGGKTLNSTNGSIFTDIYGAGKYVEKYGYDEDDKGEGDSWFMRSDKEVEDDEKDDRPFYDKGYNDAATEICNSKLLVKPK